MEPIVRKAKLHRRALACAPLAALMLLLAACGEKDYKNELRPPAPINVTAYVSDKAVSVSPNRFGAGPIVVIVTNQSQTSQEATFETDELGGTQSGIKQSTAPINPGETGQLKLDVRQGNYRVKVGSPAIRPAPVAVGSQRESAQNKVLQP